MGAMPAPRLLALLAVLACRLREAGALRSILDKLLEDYDSIARPSDSVNASCDVDEGDKDPVFIDIGIEMLSIDQKAKTVHIDGYMRAHWTDARLAFPKEVCRNQIVLPSIEIDKKQGKTLWTPGYYVQNAATVKMGSTEDEAVFISRDGSVFWSRRLHLEMNCPKFSYGQAPWDTQYCEMTIGVYRYKATQVHLSWLKTANFHGIDVINRKGLRAGEWSVEVVEVREATKEYASGTYRYAQACFKLKRESFFFPITMVIALLLVVATYSGLFVSHEAAPARVSLSFLCFLMVITNINAVQHRLPPVSAESRVWLLDFFLGTMIFNFLLLLEYAVVNYLATRRKRELAEQSLFEAEVRHIFTTFDESQRGSLDADGVRRMCALLGLDMAAGEVDDLVSAADTSGNGLLEFGELMSALNHREKGGGSYGKILDALGARHFGRRLSRALSVGREEAVKAELPLERTSTVGTNGTAGSGGHRSRAADVVSTAGTGLGRIAASTANAVGDSIHVANLVERRIAASAMRRVVSVTDTRCRWLFPLAYGLFLAGLLMSWPFYDHLDTCDYA